MEGVLCNVALLGDGRVLDTFYKGSGIQSMIHIQYYDLRVMCLLDSTNITEVATRQMEGGSHQENAIYRVSRSSAENYFTTF